MAAPCGLLGVGSTLDTIFKLLYLLMEKSMPTPIQFCRINTSPYLRTRVLRLAVVSNPNSIQVAIAAF